MIISSRRLFDEDHLHMAYTDGIAAAKGIEKYKRNISSIINPYKDGTESYKAFNQGIQDHINKGV
jgi:hypothetical protein